jgi:hypothetical protein
MSKISPEADVWHHNLDDVVKVIVPLPCQDEHKKLAGFAVDKDGVERVRDHYEAVRSVPLGIRDSMVLAQKPRDMTLKRLEACKQLRDAYRARLAKEDFDDQDGTSLERQLLSPLSSVIKVWKTGCNSILPSYTTTLRSNPLHFQKPTMDRCLRSALYILLVWMLKRDSQKLRVIQKRSLKRSLKRL